MYMSRSILVGVPLGKDYKIDARIATTLAYWDLDEKVEVYYTANAFPALGRDKIFQYAKYRIPHPSHILFLDADVLPRKSTLDTLIKNHKDIIMGVYPVSKNGKLRWSISRESTYKPMAIDSLPRTPFKISSGGFGVVLVKYEVFEKLQWPYWKNIFVPGDVEMGEDIYFCEKAKEADFDIWCDPKVKCSHIRIANLLNILKENK